MIPGKGKANIRGRWVRGESFSFPSTYTPIPIEQREAYVHIIATSPAFAWRTFIRKKLVCVFECSYDDFDDPDIDRAIAYFQKGTSFSALCWLKTVANCWTTSVVAATRVKNTIERGGWRRRDGNLHLLLLHGWQPRAQDR